jgi:mRNA-degrading endonuclease toxin of MazEF toxin-antitoxin module
MVQWGIYLARIGFIESGNTKIRPLLVLNEPVGVYGVVMVAPIYSTKDNHTLAGDIRINALEGLSMGLIRPSTIRLHRIVAISIKDLEEMLGQAPTQLQSSVKENLKVLFNL